MDVSSLSNGGDRSLTHQLPRKPPESGQGLFRIPTVRLEPSDRRLLSSTVESLLSRNEQLVLNAASFCRDVLLADFPPETFIQESSLSQSLLQIVKESWEDSMINYVGFHTLLTLANQLSINIGFLNSSEFYQKNSSIPNSSQNLSFKDADDDMDSTHVSTEYFLNSYFHLMSGISRCVTYQPESPYLWLLLEAYSNVLQSYLNLYKSSNVTALHVNLEEILLDVSQTFLRNLSQVNPVIVATIVSSLLSNFHRDGEAPHKLFTSDVRRAIWALAANTQLAQSCYAPVRQHFIDTALPFEDDLKKAVDVNENDTSVEMFRSASWWKLDVIHEQLGWKDKENMNSTSPASASSSSNQLPEDKLSRILYGIQNAVDHATVIDGIWKLWLHLVPLIRVNQLGEFDDILGSSTSWRETFYRFLSVEPTSSEDVDLLSRVLDLISFLLRSAKKSKLLGDWILPLVTDKNSAMLRLMLHESSECVASTSSICLTTLNVSIFDLFLGLLGQDDNSNKLGEFFNICGETIKLSYNSDFGSKVILHIIFKSLAHLIPTELLREKLLETAEVALSLVDITSEALLSLLQNTADGSYRNLGAVRYGSAVLVHLSEILMKNPAVPPTWISHCAKIVPTLWEIDNVLIRAASLQICANITLTEAGVFSLNSQLEPPSLLWRLSYTRLTDPSEASLVKERAATVLLNLIDHWVQMKVLLAPHTDIPRLKLLEEIAVLIKSICWCPSVTEVLAASADTPVDQAKSLGLPFITPSVLSLVTPIIVRMMQTFDEDQINDIQENLPLLRDISIKLSRVLGSFSVKEMPKLDDEETGSWGCQCLMSLANAAQALTSTVELDRTLILTLIGDRQNLSTLFSYFDIPLASTDLRLKSVRIVFALWRNVFVLLSTLLLDSGQNFEDLERLIWNHRTQVFGKLIEWLEMKTPATYRKSALEFLDALLSKTYECRYNHGNLTDTFLCQFCIQGDETYGMLIGTALLKFLEQATDIEERTSILLRLNHLCLLSPTGNNHLISSKIVHKIIKILRDIGVQAVDFQCNNRKNTKSLELLKSLLLLLTTLFTSREARTAALEQHFPDVLHTVFKLIKSAAGPDQTLLQITLECLINFTEQFPEGSHALTLTTGLVGVTSRKIASPNSLYLELLGILQEELESLERVNKSSGNLRTIDLLLAFVNNTSFSVECRTILAKGKVLNFITKFHQTEIKKWGWKYPNLKTHLLKILVQLTISSDIQLFLTKQVPECVTILIALSKIETSPNRLYALLILRNLSFHPGNRARLLHEAEFLMTLTECLSDSDSLEELECAAVTLWSVTANSEKGKVAAKRAICVTALGRALKNLKASQSSLETGDPSIESTAALITLLQKVANVQISVKS